MLGVVLGKDNQLVREGIDREVGLDLAGAAGDPPTLLSLIEELVPDGVITDIRMPPTGTDQGIQAADHQRRTHPAIGVAMPPKVAEQLVSASTRSAASDLDRLTAREREILEEMAQGKSNAAIAATLVLSERAVEKHSNAIFSKPGLAEERDVNRRVKAVLLWLAEQPSAARGG